MRQPSKPLLAALAVAASISGPVSAQGVPSIDLAKLEANAARRWPQPVLVADLADIPALNDKLGRLGTTRQVVRTPDGGVQIVIDYGGFLGFGSRPVALPLAGIAMLGRQVVVMDISLEQLDALPSWTASSGSPLPRTDIVKVGLTRN